MARAAVLLLLFVLSACGAPARRPPPVAPPPVQPPAPPPPLVAPPIVAFQNVWTRDAGTLLRTDAGGVAMPYIFMRLEVLRVDSAELLVRCAVCPGSPEGWIPRESVVHWVRRPEVAARLDLAEFVLAVREAASQRDVEALRTVMSRDFAHTLGPLEMGQLETFAAWEREAFRSLDRLPFLLDRGVATVPNTPIWAAPPEYTAQIGYNDLRAGFRRGPQGWEWIFLVRGGT